MCNILIFTTLLCGNTSAIFVIALTGDNSVICDIINQTDAELVRKF